MSGDAGLQSEILLYQTEDGRTRVQCRFDHDTLWLTQALIAELFQVSVPTVNEHLKGIYADAELVREATIRKFRIVRFEGARQVTREIEHYNLDAILAVGFRVRSHRGTQFRQWALARLHEYLVKGFTMDDERLKNPPGRGQTDYFDELLQRIRDIRSSERRFYQKVLDIYATSVDYTPDTEMSQQFFATVQNKMHWATRGHFHRFTKWWARQPQREHRRGRLGHAGKVRDRVPHPARPRLGYVDDGNAGTAARANSRRPRACPCARRRQGALRPGCDRSVPRFCIVCCQRCRHRRAR